MSKKQKTCMSDWKTAAALQIDDADEEAVCTIQADLEILTDRAKARLCEIKKTSNDFTNGCMVEMTSSNQSQDQDVGRNMASREVDASFTAGPEAAEFTISFSNEDQEDFFSWIRVESELFLLEDSDFGEVSDEEIGKFLTKAGLYSARTRNGKDAKDDAERRRWAYAEVLNEAIELVREKYGHQCSLGVNLGIDCENIYGFLGLDY